MMRENTAIGPTASATTGRTSENGAVLPATGNHPSDTANT